MKIVLYVSILDQPGGAETATRRLAEQFGQRGHKVTIVTTQAISQWVRKRSIIDYTKNIRIARLPIWQRNSGTFSSMLWALAAGSFPFLLRGVAIMQLRGLNPDTLRLAQIARRIAITTICVPMASGAFGDVTSYPSRAPHHPSAFDWISALTSPQRAEVINWGFPAERTSVIPNGIDIDLFKPPPHPVHEPHVLFVGQFRPEKRVDLLLRAWALVQREHPQTRLTLVGGGQYLAEYQHLASQLGIAPTFIPNTDTAGVLGQLHRNSIFVQSGVSEGMSNALLEAMAVGLAPIVSDTPANRTVITPEMNGLTYQADSSDALTEQLIRLINNTPLRQRLGAAARATVVQRFTLNSVVDQYLALYAQLLGEKR